MNKHCVLLSSRQELGYGRSIGLYGIASFLRNNGWACTTVDYFTYWDKKDLAQYLKNHITEDTKWVGVSYTWIYDIPDQIRTLVSFIKTINPKILIIFGGQTPYEHDLSADYYVYGYAESAILKILDYEFDQGAPVFYTKLFNGKFVDAIHNYASYNLPNYSIEYKDDDFISDKDSLTVEFSRGCKFKCDFCSFPFIGIKEDTSTSEENLYRELMTNYQKWGVTTYIVADETVNDRVEKLIKIKNVVNRLDFKPDFTAFARADLFRSHPEKIELMAECRIWGHFYGIETFNWESGKSVGKGLNPEYVKESLLTVKDYFLKHLGRYRGTISMIAGLPHETLDNLLESHKWLVNNWRDQDVVWWPLQIVDNGKLSAMGKDFAKYGYEKIDLQNTPKDPTRANTEVYWKNQHTDKFEVIDLIEKEFTEMFRLSNFQLWNVLPYMTYEEAIKLKRNDPWRILYHRARVHEYIDQKKKS